MQFMKLRTTELKHSALSHFCVQSFGNNFTIENPVTEAVVLQLNREPDVAELFPFIITSVDIPSEQLATNLLKSVDFRKIYENSSVEEQQEFGLDPIFVAECSVERTKSRLLQAQHSPETARYPMLAIISTYGACHILIKNSYDRLWKQFGNLTKMLITEVFPIVRSPVDMKTYAELNGFVSFYIMTACAWHSCGDIIYTANAAGFLIAFKIEYESSEEFITEKKTWTFLSKTSTDLGRITFLKAFDDFLIAVSIDGTIRLFKFKFNKNSNDTIANFECLDMLWSHKDRMCCRQIVAEKCKSDSGYVISYAKGANLICMKISDEGKIEANSSLYISGIKITGLELFHENQLIVAAIAGKVWHVTYSCIRDCSVSLHLKADSVFMAGLDAKNLQILGMGATTNKALWLFITHHNKESPISLKQSLVPTNLMLYKPNNIDPLSQLNNIDIDTMDPYHDFIVALRMDIWHSNIVEKCKQQYSVFSNIKVQKFANETLLRKMQLQLEISQAILRRSRYKMQGSSELISGEIEFMELGTQIIHILLRLQYLQGLINNQRKLDASAGLNTLTEFQRRSAYSMRKFFYVLTEKLKVTANETTQKDVIKKLKQLMFEFVEMASRTLHLKCKDFEIIDSVEEKCFFCHEIMSDKDVMCRFGHNLKRCSVSFVQLPWFNNVVCPQCGTMALGYQDSREVLKELYPSTESVKCTICRSAFINKEVK